MHYVFRGRCLIRANDTLNYAAATDNDGKYGKDGLVLRDGNSCE